MESSGTANWDAIGSAMALALVRVSTMLGLSPLFNTRAFAARTKAIFSIVLCALIVPALAARAGGAAKGPGLSFPALLGEVALGAVYGLTLSFFGEMLLLAGQIVGLQFSFSLVNLLDPASEIQTPLMGDLFQLMGTLVLFAAGLDRVMLASILRSFQAIPPGQFALSAVGDAAHLLVPLLSGAFLAALELAAPVLAATVLVEIAVALMGKLSPQLPVISLTVPLKTLTGFSVLIGSLAVWPVFLEARFSRLLDVAERLAALGLHPGGK
jgi:flagellar biosynthetic protein FliR